MVRSFEVRARNAGSVCFLSKDLDRKLAILQENGWKILNVISCPCKEWDYPKYFDSTLFTIIAEHE